MKFARTVFLAAGLWGFLVLTPLYFMEQTIGQQSPPAVTHPEYYYGFLGVSLAWQVLFLLLASDPARYRPVMIPAILEKISFVLAGFVLYGTGRVAATMAVFAGLDLLWAVLFVVAFLKTGHRA
ncbi:MAG TPA: hypothetical protein V6C99_06080 [Oculatellaceae cyanobacterium]